MEHKNVCGDILFNLLKQCDFAFSPILAGGKNALTP